MAATSEEACLHAPFAGHLGSFMVFIMLQQALGKPLAMDGILVSHFTEKTEAQENETIPE